MKTSRSTSTFTPKRLAAIAAWSTALVLAMAPSASLAQATCGVNVDNYTPNQYVLGTYDGSDYACLAAFSTYTVPPYYGKYEGRPHLLLQWVLSHSVAHLAPRSF
jgi:hypothetical protein